MHTGALMAVRQFLGQYLMYAKPWQRGLIAVAVIGGGAALTAAGIVTGHVTMTVIGCLLLLGTGNACVQIIRARHGSSGRKGVLGMFAAVWLSMHYG
jgi:hypothetical protein